MTLNTSDQLQLHSQLHFESLKFITEHKDQMNLPNDAIEHIIWFHYSSQEWTDELLLRIIEEYKKEPFIALESLIIRGLKHDSVTTNQYDIIDKFFPGKEIKRQLFFWLVRRKLNRKEELTKNEVERILELRGFTYLEEAFEKGLINESFKELFSDPKPGDNDKKHKEKLYKRAINLK
jgi:hypothetical protein